MTKCKITVIKRHFDSELAEQYAIPGFGICTRHEEGQSYICDWRKPDGLCDEAWKSFHHYVMAIANGGGNFFGGNWLKEDVAIVACSDGIRPVIFKLEPVEE